MKTARKFKSMFGQIISQESKSPCLSFMLTEYILENHRVATALLGAEYFPTLPPFAILRQVI